MKTKPADVPYCGVDKNKIATAQPIIHESNFKHLYDWIIARYMVKKRKDTLKLPPPWTKNPILQEFKFTNVKREHDRETKWILQNIVHNPNLSYENKLMNLTLFRMYNKKETLAVLYSLHDNNPIDFNNLRPLEEYRKALQEHKDNYFTNAFLTCGLKVSLGNNPVTNDTFMPMRPLKFAISLWEDGLIDKIRQAQSQLEVFEVLKGYNGLGTFLAYQIFVDYTYIPEFPFSENEFTVSGPGCDRGLKYIFIDFDGMNMEEALFWLRDNIEQEFKAREWKWSPHKLFDDLPEYDRSMNVMSLENCMCEISKYIRAVEGTGRPKNKYKGGK